MKSSQPDDMGPPEYAERNPESPQAGYVERSEKCPFQQLSERSWAVYRMADIVTINRHPDILGYGPAAAPGGTLGAERPLIPLDFDGEEHRKFRRLLSPLFSSATVARMEPEIRRTTLEVLSQIEKMDGRAEMYSSFCTPLPSLFFCKLMGVPESDLPRFHKFKDDVIRPQGSTPAEFKAFARNAGKLAYEYFSEVCDRRARMENPGDDLLGLIMKAEIQGERLTRTQLLDVLYLLMIAGLDTVTSSLSCIIAWLAAHPSERDKLVADPSLVPSAIEELLRFESPVLYGSRTAARDVEINGRFFPEGTEFVPSWPAANLDPAAFESPLSVDLSRSPNKHIAFASGFHQCLGIHLARLELRVAIEELHKRIPDYALDPEDPVRYTAVGVRGATHLPLVWGKTRGDGTSPSTLPPHDAISFTAKLAALARAETGIKFAAEVSELLDAPSVGSDLAIRVNSPGAIPPAMLPYIEARYRSIESSIRQSGIQQVLEFASGVSFRGLAMTMDSYALKYIESDLPGITAEKRALMRRLLDLHQNTPPVGHHLAEANILCWESIEPLLSQFEPGKPVAVVTEGLLMYLSHEEKIAAVSNIRRILTKFGGFWITPDFIPAAKLSWLFRDVDPGYERAISTIADRTGRDFGSRMFASETEAEAFCRGSGFDVEVRNQLDGSFTLSRAYRPVEQDMHDSLKLWTMRAVARRGDGISDNRSVIGR